MNAFTWWHVVDGVAHAFPDTAEIRARVDTERNWFGSIEGAIIHGGVRATAFYRERVELFDATEWLRTGAHVPAGYRDVTVITADRG